MTKKVDKHIIDDIKRLVDLGLTDPEISKKLSMGKNSVSLLRKRWIGPNPNYMDRHTKHKHLHKQALIKFQNSSFEETAKELELTLSEMKSLFTVAYKNKKLKHIRKDKRTKEKWTNYQLSQMLKMIGLRPRKAIAKKIDRGNDRVIKEKLQNIGLKNPKYTNGLSLSRYKQIFNYEPSFYFHTDAGPGTGPGNHQATYFKIIPWVYIDDQIKNKQINPPNLLKQWVEIMAMFQEWIHENNSYGSMLDIVSEISKE